MKIAVCDDEKETRDWIRSRILRLYPEAQVVLFSDAAALCDSTEAFDIIFLDIKMNGMDGMEAARRLRQKGCTAALIFVTALDDCVFQAFDVGAFHYLVKPVDRVKFYEVLRRAAEQKFPEPADGGSVVVKNGRSHICVRLSDILYAEVLNRKVTLHTANGEIEYYGRLNELEKQADGQFFCPHRAYLVNLKYVSGYNGTEIFLDQGQVPVAKQKYADFVKKYLEYHRKAGKEP